MLSTFSNFLQWAATEKFGMLGLVLMYNRDLAQYDLELNLYC
jgi:hypothetical protein